MPEARAFGAIAAVGGSWKTMTRSWTCDRPGRTVSYAGASASCVTATSHTPLAAITRHVRRRRTRPATTRPTAGLQNSRCGSAWLCSCRVHRRLIYVFGSDQTLEYTPANDRFWPSARCPDRDDAERTKALNNKKDGGTNRAAVLFFHTRARVPRSPQRSTHCPNRATRQTPRS